MNREFMASEDGYFMRKALYAYGEMIHGRLHRSNNRTAATDALEASFTNPKPDPPEDMASERHPGEFVRWLISSTAQSWLQCAWMGQGRR